MDFHAMKFLVLTCILALASSFQGNIPWTTRKLPTPRLFSTTSYSQEQCEAIKAALPSPLIDSQGNVIESAETIATLVQNQRVALYFAAGWSRHCRELDFMLAQYRSALRDSSQPIQLIYVPSDKTTEDQLARMNDLGIDLGVPLGEAADALKKQYGVWPDAEVDKFGGFARQFIDDGEYVIGDDDLENSSEGNEKTSVMDSNETAETEIVIDPEELPEDDSGRRSGIPAFVVLDNKGQEFCFLNTERDSITALADWPLDDPEGHW
jgi:hypothetical protein